MPATLAAGEALYGANCARCHGERGAGTNQGPTFLTSIYLPSHHADAAFQLAVQRGVTPHHWQFGPMDAVPGLTAEQVAEITAYVRWLQREAGVR